MAYPTDEAGRQQLADELTAKGLKPTQRKGRFRRAHINRIVSDMMDGSFDWADSARQPIFIGPEGQIANGHHRIIAAHLAGIDLAAAPGQQIRRLARCLRPDFAWIDVLPDVQ